MLNILSNSTLLVHIVDQWCTWILRGLLNVQNARSIAQIFSNSNYGQPCFLRSGGHKSRCLRRHSQYATSWSKLHQILCPELQSTATVRCFIPKAIPSSFPVGHRQCVFTQNYSQFFLEVNMTMDEPWTLIFGNNWSSSFARPRFGRGSIKLHVRFGSAFCVGPLNGSSLV